MHCLWFLKPKGLKPLFLTVRSPIGSQFFLVHTEDARYHL
jgi:hypothetical protein